MDFRISAKTSIDIIFVLKGSMEKGGTIFWMAVSLEKWVANKLCCLAGGNSFELLVQRFYY